MRLLLDTHVLLWAAGDAHKLPTGARKLLADPRNEPCFSAASLWEIAIKASLGRADFHVDVGVLRRGLLENGYREVPVTSEHAVATALLPPLHKDPFDRMLLAQAALDDLLLVTADEVLARYPGPIRKV